MRLHLEGGVLALYLRLIANYFRTHQRRPNSAKRMPV